MNYATIKTHDVANGTGIRVSLFVSGCTHKCKGCFNAEAWDFNYGQLYTPEVEDRVIKALEPSYIRGLSLLGGEPLEPQNQSCVLALLKRVKEIYPDKTVWCYSGYTLENDILSGGLGSDAREILEYIDVLVDGEFIESKKDLNLRFRGSSNQRLIDMRATLECGSVVLCTEI
jgi:anaerobic ribonucleoside-triphosphate reductase activating protein